ncbi:hypothetical protein CTI12_AA376100 [Artemisia annua]|uniref:TTF-type domain-containing protein n=1 Tax=Artemisia annua TaxID=35608 RepID=A0A2U1MIK2_ARTAN|nr:hypothetical protein CTI12_AA376100 [Artemisia annua]
MDIDWCDEIMGRLEKEQVQADRWNTIAKPDAWRNSDTCGTKKNQMKSDRYLHETQPSYQQQQDVNDNHVNESPRVEPEKDVHTSSKGRTRSFQEVWFKRFWWLEYSETKDAAYYLPCYLFNKKPIGRVGSDRFTKQGFNMWKKVNHGNDCAFITHEEKEVIENRLRLKTTIESVKWLTVQTWGLRVSDERPGSKNQGNLLESTTSQKGDAAYCLEHLLSFDFVIVMHIMKEIIEMTDKLCQALQHRSQDIINALALVSTTKTLLQKLRDEGWHSLMGKVTLACENNNIPLPDMNVTYRNLIQSQLLRLSVALDPRKSFKIDDICTLVKKFYHLDFTDQEKIQLKAELQHYELDVRNHLSFKKVSKLSALCKGLHDTGKSKSYPLVERLIRLILTLPVSTPSNMIIDAFNSKKKRRVRFQIPKVQVERSQVPDDETQWHL